MHDREIIRVYFSFSSTEIPHKQTRQEMRQDLLNIELQVDLADYIAT